MKAIYATTGSEDWVEAAQKLNREEGLHPCYWITHDLKKAAKETFENVIIHDSFDAMYGDPPKEYDPIPANCAIDAEILSKFQKYEAIAVKMMERLSSDRNNEINLSYNDRMKLYYRQLLYWTNVVNDLDPDVAIFGSTPHLVYDYILYAVCIESNIKTVITTHTTLPNRFCVRNRLYENPIGNIKSDKENINLPSEIENHFRDIQSEYSQAKPEYMEQDLRELQSTEKYEFYTNFIRCLENSHTISIKVMRKAKNIVKNLPSNDSDYISQVNYVIENIKRRHIRHKLKREYTNYTKDVNLCDRYIYFPLHYQPERTTSPEGGRYVHQYLALDLLSSAIPDTTHIFVKEHPSQFSSRLQGERGRPLGYYFDLCTIENVRLVPIETNSFDLIDNSEAVATITGTAGWEGLLRGKQALVFGNAWYRSAPGCYYIKNKEHLSKVLKKKINTSSIDVKKVKEFVSKSKKELYIGSLNKKSEKGAESLAQAVQDVI